MNTVKKQTNKKSLTWTFHWSASKKEKYISHHSALYYDPTGSSKDKKIVCGNVHHSIESAPRGQ